MNVRANSEAFAAEPTTIGDVPVSKPQTGAVYLESLRDGREVFLYGERVKDVTTHPAFRNTARMVARLYDALHDDKRKSKILVPTETGNGGMTHAFFKAPKTPEEMLAGRTAIAEWAKLTYGWLGGSTEEIRRYCLFGAQASGNADRFKGFAEECMAEYDLDGWRVPDLTDPSELSYHATRSMR